MIHAAFNFANERKGTFPFFCCSSLFQKIVHRFLRILLYKFGLFILRGTKYRYDTPPSLVLDHLVFLLNFFSSLWSRCHVFFDLGLYPSSGVAPLPESALRYKKKKTWYHMHMHPRAVLYCFVDGRSRTEPLACPPASSKNRRFALLAPSKQPIATDGIGVSLILWSSALNQKARSAI